LMLIKIGACSLEFWKSRCRHRPAESCTTHASSYYCHYSKFPKNKNILKQGLTRFPSPTSRSSSLSFSPQLYSVPKAFFPLPQMLRSS
jgi:hypothetical protein